MCCLLKFSSLYHVNRFSLNTLWIIYYSGNSIWNASWPISFEILKGPYLFWSSFFKDCFEWIFLAFSHTLSPIFSSCEFLFFCWTVSSWILLLYSSIFLLCSNSFVILLGNCSVFVILFLLLSFPSIDIFQN